MGYQPVVHSPVPLKTKDLRLDANMLLDDSDDSEILWVINKVRELFPQWKMKALRGEDPPYSNTIGYDLAKIRAKVKSYDALIRHAQSRRNELEFHLQEDCPHDFVAEWIGDPKAEYSHRQHDRRVCEVCGLDENGPGAKYNKYDRLSDKNMGRTTIRRVDFEEFNKLTKIRKILDV